MLRASSPPALTVHRPAKLRQTGVLPAITPEIITETARLRASGLPLRSALALINQRLTVSHFNSSLSKSTVLSGLWESKLAEYLLPLTQSIIGTGGKENPMPVGTCWMLERSFPDDFGQRKGGTQVNVQVNTVVGLGDDVLRRAAKLVSTNDKMLPRAGQFRSRKQERQAIVEVTATATTTPSATQSSPPATPTAESQSPKQ